MQSVLKKKIKQNYYNIENYFKNCYFQILLILCDFQVTQLHRPFTILFITLLNDKLQNALQYLIAYILKIFTKILTSMSMWTGTNTVRPT